MALSIVKDITVAKNAVKEITAHLLEKNPYIYTEMRANKARGEAFALSTVEDITAQLLAANTATQLAQIVASKAPTCVGGTQKVGTV